ncbi:MAG: hypothetical protein COB50_05500 [Thiotrichales bacterium]|nr:MAG: hypothetical protein COB50_05500 [Thiotrichales bacterium]
MRLIIILFLIITNSITGATSEREAILALFTDDYAVLSKPRPKAKQLISKRNIVVAIDAGHGGRDPGAVGPRGTLEKDITLAIAKKLKRLIDREPRLTAVLIRTKDCYVNNRNRFIKARKHNADLFISIHADATKHRKAMGASVYTLSDRGASREATHLLTSSNNSLSSLGDIRLEDKSSVLTSVLLDLSQSASKRASVSLAQHLLRSLAAVQKLHKNHVGYASFSVLKAPDIPSVLIEAGFISNYRMERKLKSSKYQMQLARAILQGIRRYCRST